MIVPKTKLKMKIQDYSSLESQLKITQKSESNNKTTSTIASVMLLLEELKEILFENRFGNRATFKNKHHHF